MNTTLYINSEIELEKLSEMVIKSYTDERLPLNQIKIW